MKAMVLAAGLGTRLRPLTDIRPKALVEVNCQTLLEITLARLRDAGVSEVIINVHHFADMIVDYLKRKGNFDMRIEVSREEVLLDTGGGLKKASWFFLKDSGGSDKPFILHNVDVISNIDLERMLEFHTEHDALATLAVQRRQSSRYLLFDQQLQLCGRQEKEGKAEMVHPSSETQPQTQALGFSGIHIISPRFFEVIEEYGIFSIIDSYVNLAERGEKILAFRADEYQWRDVGRLEELIQAGK